MMKRVLILEMAIAVGSAVTVLAQSKGQAPAATGPAKMELAAVDVGGLVILRGGGVQGAGLGADMAPSDLPPGSGLHMVAPRGGYASGLAVVRGQALSGVAAVAPKLTGPGGAVLPATAVQVRWLTGERFAEVFTEKPMEKQIQPLLLTVQAPAGAAAGPYVGKLSVTGAGFSGALDVQVDVMPWQVPPPKNWPMLTGLVHSPDTITNLQAGDAWQATFRNKTVTNNGAIVRRDGLTTVRVTNTVVEVTNTLSVSGTAGGEMQIDGRIGARLRGSADVLTATNFVLLNRVSGTLNYAASASLDTAGGLWTAPAFVDNVSLTVTVANAKGDLNVNGSLSFASEDGGHVTLKNLVSGTTYVLRLDLANGAANKAAVDHSVRNPVVTGMTSQEDGNGEPPSVGNEPARNVYRYVCMVVRAGTGV